MASTYAENLRPAGGEGIKAGGTEGIGSGFEEGESLEPSTADLRRRDGL